MKVLLNYLNILLQVIFTFMLLMFVFMILAFLQSSLGFDGLIGLIVSFLWAIVFSLITILLCFIVGLPLRLNSKLKLWWDKNYLIAPIGLISGLCFIIVSMLPNFAYITVEESFGPDGFSTTRPNEFFSTIGWFLTAFMSLHIALPPAWKNKLSNFTDKKILDGSGWKRFRF